jgi:hypothetical protein
MQLSKNSSQIFSPYPLANIKGTVSGTFLPPPSISEVGLLRLPEADCQRFVMIPGIFQKPIIQHGFFEPGQRHWDGPGIF